MKNNILFIMVFFLCHFALAQKCDVFSEMKKMNVHYPKIEKSPNFELEKYDFSKLLLDNRTHYLGFIGKDKNRLIIDFQSITKSKGNPKIYDVEGTTRVGKNTRKFRGKIEFSQTYLADLFSIKRLDEEPVQNVKKEGIAIADFHFDEYENIPKNGFLEGKLLIWWYISDDNQLRYNDFYNFSDNYFNNAFLGVWKDKYKSITLPFGLGHYRIPCSGNLDIGAGEFSPAKKYLKKGWKDYLKHKN